jgi:thioesterase DpgC
MQPSSARVLEPASTGAAPRLTGELKPDSGTFSSYWLENLRALDTLPAKPQRNAAQAVAAAMLLKSARESRQLFLARHAPTLYRQFTANLTRKLRVEELARMAADTIPGLVPDQARLDAERPRAQRDKDGHEIDQGIFFNAVLADRECGLDLCHAMMLPRRESLELEQKFARDGKVDLGTASVERKGKVATVWFQNGRSLHAEDETTVHQVETCVDLALLDREVEVAVLRGAPIKGGKYDGIATYCTGINLTHLYQGQIPYIWYLVREMGFINKIYRGLAYEHVSPSEVDGATIEKPWIAAVEKFAIGGGCQYLLVMDYTIAANDAYMTLPARKEGIVPGAANMRLPRFVGDRIARQAIQAERRIECDSLEGRMICDQIVPPDQIDGAVENMTQRLTNSGVVSIASNRRAFRIAAEPLNLFREYMAVYAREQADCHFSPALITNLERFWGAQNRKI